MATFRICLQGCTGCCNYFFAFIRRFKISFWKSEPYQLQVWSHKVLAFPVVQDHDKLVNWIGYVGGLVLNRISALKLTWADAVKVNNEQLHFYRRRHHALSCPHACGDQSFTLLKELFLCSFSLHKFIICNILFKEILLY